MASRGSSQVRIAGLCEAMRGMGVLVIVVLGLPACATSRVSQFGRPITPGSSCSFPSESVEICESTRGYRFAIPSPGTCAAGSHGVGVVRLTCEALERPAYHACLDDLGHWTAVPSWEPCASRGLSDAPGDFVPPGRSAAQGVAPDPATVRISYSTPAWAVFGVSGALTPLFGVGVLGLIFGGPILHWTHGHVGRGFAVLGMNLGLGSGLGALGGVILGGGNDAGVLLGAGGGALLGLVVANILNAAAFSYDEVPNPRLRLRAARVNVVPRLDVTPGGAQLVLLGSF